MDINLLILYVIFPISLIIDSKKNSSEKTMLFTRNESSYLRGMAALMVVFAHYCLRLEEENRLSLLVLPFRFLGPLGVAVFFFLSGYGLYISNGIEHLKFNFIKRRVLNVYLPYVLIRLFILPLNNILNMGISTFKEYCLYVVGITQNPSWFVVVIILMYLFYYIVSFFPISKNDKVGILFALVVFLSIALFKANGYAHSYWYGNNLIFPLGVLCGIYNEHLLKLIRNCKGYLLAASILLFCTTTGLYFFLDQAALIIDKMFTGIWLISICIILFYQFDFSSRILCFLGKYSLYIYLTHSVIYRLLENYFTMAKVTTTLFYFALVIVIPIILKFLIDCIISKVHNN